MEQPTAEDIILKTLLLKAHLEHVGVYDEVVKCMEEYASSAVSKHNEELSAKILPILESMDSKIFDRQKIGGFETFFDFIGEDIESIKSLLSNPSTTKI